MNVEMDQGPSLVECRELPHEERAQIWARRADRSQDVALTLCRIRCGTTYKAKPGYPLILSIHTGSGPGYSHEPWRLDAWWVWCLTCEIGHAKDESAWVAGFHLQRLRVHQHNTDRIGVKNQISCHPERITCQGVSVEGLELKWNLPRLLVQDRRLIVPKWRRQPSIKHRNHIMGTLIRLITS